MEQEISLEKKILLIIDKVKKMYKYNNNLVDLLKYQPEIKIELENNKLKLVEISFSYYNTLIIQETHIDYYEENSNKYMTLYEYKDFNELINLK